MNPIGTLIYTPKIEILFQGTALTIFYLIHEGAISYLMEKADLETRRRLIAVILDIANNFDPLKEFYLEGFRYKRNHIYELNLNQIYLFCFFMKKQLVLANGCIGAKRDELKIKIEEAKRLRLEYLNSLQEGAA